MEVENCHDLCSVLNKKFADLALVFGLAGHATPCTALTGVWTPLVYHPGPSWLCASEFVSFLGLGGLGNGHCHKAMAAAITTTDQRIPMCDAN